MVYTAYSCENIYMKRINVAGGGLSNGNAYAVIEILYNDEDMNEVDGVWYKEFGRNPISKHIGDDVEWGDDDTFKVLLDGVYVDDEDKEEEEEEEEEEAKEDEEEAKEAEERKYEEAKAVIAKREQERKHKQYQELQAHIDKTQQEFLEKRNKEIELLGANQQKRKDCIVKYKDFLDMIDGKKKGIKFRKEFRDWLIYGANKRFWSEREEYDYIDKFGRAMWNEEILRKTFGKKEFDTIVELAHDYGAFDY